MIGLPFNNCRWERLLYSQLSGGIDNYIASYPLKYYHTVNCLGERLLYSQYKGEILLYSQLSVIGLLFNTCNCLGKDYYIASCPGDRQLYSQVSINMLPYNQFSGEKVTI